MNVLYTINGLGFSKNTGIGGADKRVIEVVRNISKIDKTANLDILTTSSGYKIFKNNERLDTEYYVITKPFWWPKFINKFIIGRVLSYFYATFVSIFRFSNFRKYDLFFSSSDFFFDVIPSWFFKKIHNKKMICMIHHNIKNPRKRDGSVVINTSMYLSQRFSYWLISKTADAIFLYDTAEGRKIKKIITKHSKPKANFHFVKNGIDDELIDSVSKQKKIYEACFLGGLRYSKGIDEFVPIWSEVIKKFPKAKFKVIGGGSDEIVKKLKTEIRDSGLEKNILLTGPLSGKKLFEVVKKSKLFLFPSHEEGWGIALCEAMYCGLPIICYDLPAFKTFGNTLDKSEIGDYRSLANKTIHYLKNEDLIKSRENKLIETAKKYTWGTVAEEDYKIFNKINKKS